MKQIMKEEQTFSEVSIVVIGYNEAENLDNTFIAIQNLDYPQNNIEIIYVDTDSNDNSVEIAQKYTKKVFVEESHYPTAALARNRGLLEAKYDIVHFVDGDIELDKNYVKNATIKLQENKVQSVFGTLDEKSKSYLSDILISHWKQKKEGLTSSAGAGGTFLKRELLNINGYDERIKRGEEIDLGERFLAAGYKIWLMDVRMGFHKYKIKNMFQLIKRHFDNGKSIGFNALLPEKSNYLKNHERKTRKWLMYSLIFLIVLLGALIISPFYTLLILLCMYLLINFYIVFKYRDLIKQKKYINFLDQYISLLSFPVKVAGILTTWIKVLFYKIKGINLIQPKQKFNL